MKKMDVLEHLEELRRVLIRTVVILTVSFMVAYGFGESLVEFFLHPLKMALAKKDLGPIVYLGVLDKVISQFQMAFWSGVALSSPLWFCQIWSFIRPGLYPYEAKVIRPFLLIGFFFFWSGVGFGYFLVFPFALEIFLNFGVQEIQAAISLKEYLSLACKALVFFGLVFQLPNILIILGFMGVVTKDSLKEMRRYIYVGLAFLAALLTPPDPYTMLGLWLPLIVLFEIGVLAVAFIVHPYLKRQKS